MFTLAMSQLLIADESASDEQLLKVEPMPTTFLVFQFFRGSKFVTIGLRMFEENPYCRCCNRNRAHADEFNRQSETHTDKFSKQSETDADKFNRQFETLLGDEYDLLTPFMTRNKPIRIRHRTCGTVTEGLPYRFLHGKRCSFCTPRISKESLKKYVEECTGGKSHVSAIHRNQITVCDEKGNEVTDSVQFFLQELSRNDESSVFPYRIKKPEVPPCEATRVYFLAKEECERWGIWMSQEAEDKIPDSTRLKGLIKRLMKEGYLYLKKPGVFCVDPDLSDEAAMEELYVKRKGKRIGSYYMESAAYHAGIIPKKPKV